MAYNYPTLTVQEVLECFKELNINVNENDLKNPDPRRWHGFYASMFEALTNRPIDQAVQSMFKVERMQTDYHELFEEGFAQMAFTRCLQFALSHCGFTSFSIKDVIQPTPNRLQKLSSMFCNAMRHFDVKFHHAEKIQEDIQTLKAELESVFNENRKLKALLEDAKESQPQRDAELQQVQKEYDLCQQVLNELNRIQEEERRSVEKIKFCMSKIDVKKENVKQELHSVRQESEKMSLNIVQSPKRFRKDLDRCKNKVDDLKAAIVMKLQTLSESKLLLEQTANKMTAGEKANKLSKEFQYELEKDNEEDAAIHHLTERMHEYKEQYNVCCHQEEDLSEKLRVRQEQMRKMISHKDLSEQSSHQQLTDLIRHLDKIKEQEKNVETELFQKEADVAASERECVEWEKVFKEKKNENQRELEEALAQGQVMEKIVTQGWRDFKDILLGE